MKRLATLATAMTLVVMAAIPAVAGTPRETYVDSFSAQGFTGNDGTLNYEGPWVEIGESNGPTSGYVWVWPHEYCDGAFCLKMGGTDGDAEGRGVHRAVDLTGATWAQLEFDYGRELLDDESEGTAVVQVSPDGGDTWNTVKTISLDTDDGGLKFRKTIVISKWATPNTLIRFRITEAEDLEAYWLVDNITVEAEFEEATTTTSPPPTTTTTSPPATTTTTSPPATTTTRLPGTTTTTRPDSGATTTTSIPRTTTTTAPSVVSDEDVSSGDRTMMTNKSSLTITSALPAMALPTATADGPTPPGGHAEPVEALAAAFFTDSGDYGGNFIPSVVLGIVIAVLSLLGLGSRKEE